MEHELTLDELASLARTVEAQIPFNRHLGLHLRDIGQDHVAVTFDMREELVGNFTRGNLHGGVVSAVLDVVGGLAAMMSVGQNAGDDLTERFRALGTIDLRIDYLRPGLGSGFVASGTILRAGRKVAVARMELHNDEDVLIAVGTGTYIIG